MDYKETFFLVHLLAKFHQGFYFPSSNDLPVVMVCRFQKDFNVFMPLSPSNDRQCIVLGLSVRLYVYLSVFVCQSACLSASWSICLANRWFTYLPVCMSVWWSICLSVCWSYVCLPVGLSVYPFMCLSIRSSICRSVRPSVCLYIWQVISQKGNV